MKKFFIIFFFSFFLWFFHPVYSLAFTATSGSLSPSDAKYYIFFSDSNKSGSMYFSDVKRIALAPAYKTSDWYWIIFQTYSPDGWFCNVINDSNDIDTLNTYWGSENYFVTGFLNNGNYSCSSVTTNVPIFSTLEEAQNYIVTGDDTGNLNVPPAPEFDPFSSDYDDDVPVPQVITKFNVIAGVTTPVISFTNGSTDYNVVIYGRWNSINDVTLRQEKLRWVYDYSSLIHGDLECWVSDEDNRTSRENFDFFSDPHFTDTYQAFLLKYPLAERNITNDPTLFEKLTGYNEALHNFTELYMNLPNNAYSKPDFFFRYYYRDDAQNIHYSRWAHLTFPLIPPGENGFKTTTDQLWKGNLDYQVANKPLTSEEVLDVDTYFDSDQTKYNIMNNQQSYDLDEIDWTMSLSNLQSITSVFGQMPAFVATVFSCYPAWMVQLIGATITILCALAIYHGIRG